MLELCHLYWKALSFWYAKSDILLLGREAWSSAALETYLGLDIWSRMKIFLFVHLWASHIKPWRAPNICLDIRYIYILYRFLASRRNYSLWFIPGFCSLVFRISIRKNPFRPQTLTCLKKTQSNPYNTHCSGVMSLS